MSVTIVEAKTINNMRLFIVLMLIPTIFYGQSLAPKKSNTVKISGVTYEGIMNIMLDKGYRIEKSDDKFQTIVSEPFTIHLKSGKASTAKVIVYVRVKDSVAIIKGDAINMGFKFKAESGKNDVPGRAFEELYEIARISGEKIDYARENE